ncbi:hypothetical protein [Streptomyces sasae]|uniref:hypothetical protein n=1 Tax=Streptomyces sasae TaxID=1266772 RepID=UPI00292F6F07|nr:hypothetical protein [Streptomyces sasae]
MSEEIPPAGGDGLPEIDEVLAAALTAQGESGERALNLLRDAHRILVGEAGLLQAGEVAESCVRGAADALLGLADSGRDDGGGKAEGLQGAARRLLKEVDACDRQMRRRDTARSRPVSPSAEVGPSSGRPDVSARSEPDAVDVGRAPAADTSASTSDPAVEAGWERVRAAAEVLRGELTRPGGYHRRRARGIAERLMGVALGSLQEQALDVWGEVYGRASGTLHGAASGPERAAALYRQVVVAARELLVPLPGRANRVLELASLPRPGEEEVRELAGWADPRTTTFFFTSQPAPAWLAALEEHAPHLLLADKEAGGDWPAAPFIEHLATAASDIVRPWLAGHVEEIAAAGPAALDALLRLALAGALHPHEVRLLLPRITAPTRAGTEAGWTRRLAARWARMLPMSERDGDWLVVAECLVKDAVESEHAGSQAREAVLERVQAALLERAEVGTASGAVTEALADLELEEAAKRETAARLPAYEVAGLLQQLVASAYPEGAAGQPFGWIRPLRLALAGLVRRDLELTAAAARFVVFGADLDEVRLGDAQAFLGPHLARAVLDLAAADATAGIGLAERTRAWPRIAAADPHLHERLRASHLAAHPPAVDETGGTGEWWEQAIELTVRILAARPSPEGARLAALVLGNCPPEHAEQLEANARTALGTPPAAGLVAEVLPAGAEQVDGLAEPLASWLRVWDWSPVLPAGVLTGWEPVLEAARRLVPEGPADPRAAIALQPVRVTTSLDEEDLAELTAEHGPAAAAALLAAAADAGADGYAVVLHHLVDADPAAWTADAPGILAALEQPKLGAFYLAAAATAARSSGAFPTGPAAAAVAALQLRAALPSPASGNRPDAALLFADQALFDLLAHVWRTGADLAGDLPAALAHLHSLAELLTQPADPPPAPAQGPDNTPADARTDTDVSTDADGDGVEADGEPEPSAGLSGSEPAVRALSCLLEYAAGRARLEGRIPDDILDLVARVLAAHAGEDAVATAIGVQLPLLHRHAPEFTAGHPELYALIAGRPSPAAAWLRWGAPDAVLLAALDRSRLLEALQGEMPGAEGHVAHAILTGAGGFLGDAAGVWSDLAASPDGAAAASRLLAALAAHAPRRPGEDGLPLPQAASTALDAAAAWWRAALAAGLPPGALAGAGVFASAALDDDVWLGLARASAEHTPAQADADFVAERAAGHPDSEDALLLVALLVSHPSAVWYDEEVRRQARALLHAAAGTSGHEHADVLRKLRTALINAGDIDAART